MAAFETLLHEASKQWFIARIKVFSFHGSSLRLHVIFYAIPSKMVSLLRNSAHSINIAQQPLICDIFIGDINIVKDKCSNRYIRNVLKMNYVPCSSVFWSSKYKNIEWKKVWSITISFS